MIGELNVTQSETNDINLLNSRGQGGYFSWSQGTKRKQISMCGVSIDWFTQ